MTEQRVANTKVCRHCAVEIPIGAKLCCHCSQHQDWRNLLGLSNTVLALLIALISVSTPLFGYLSRPKSEINLNQLQYGHVETGDGFQKISLFGTVSNLGERPGVVESIKSLQIAPGVNIDFYLDPNSQFHNTGSRRIAISALVKAEFKPDPPIDSSSDIRILSERMIAAAKGDFSIQAIVRNYDDATQDKSAVLSRSIVLQIVQDYAWGCVRRIEEQNRSGSGNLDPTSVKYLELYNCNNFLNRLGYDPLEA